MKWFLSFIKCIYAERKERKRQWKEWKTNRIPTDRQIAIVSDFIDKKIAKELKSKLK